jgi:hypothetical protein
VAAAAARRGAGAAQGAGSWTPLAGGSGESLVDLEGELESREDGGGFDAVVGVPYEAGEHVLDHRRVGAGVGQCDGLLAVDGVLGEVAGP